MTVVGGRDLAQLKSLAKKKRKQQEQLLAKLKKLPSAKLDAIINEADAKQFKQIDCLACANCCKTTPPLIVQKDIQRIAKHLNLSAGDFMQQYVEMDEDGDFVLNQTPCPFLGADNYCSIYEVRPKACSEYPHTQQQSQKSFLKITLENTAVCPAVYNIFEVLDQKLK